jgi:hypothetical protein
MADGDATHQYAGNDDHYGGILANKLVNDTNIISSSLRRIRVLLLELDD